MILYILYNADLLDIPDNQENEDALGYVDNIALITIGDNLEETTNRLSNIMTKKTELYTGAAFTALNLKLTNPQLCTSPEKQL